METFRMETYSPLKFWRSGHDHKTNSACQIGGISSGLIKARLKLFDVTVVTHSLTSNEP